MSEDNEDSRTIFVGNLSPDVTEEILYELFLQSGPVEEISIPKKDGKNRAFGFVTYSHQVSVPYALKLYEGTRLFGRELNLKNRNSNNSINNNNSHIPSNSFPQIAPFVNNNLNNMQPLAMPNPSLMFGFNNLQPNPNQSLLQQALNHNIQQVLQANFQSQLNMFAMSTQSTTSNFLSSTPTSSRERNRDRDRDNFADRHRRNVDYRDKPYARSRSRSPRRRDTRDDSSWYKRDRDRDDSPRSRRNGSPTRRNFYRR